MDDECISYVPQGELTLRNKPFSLFFIPQLLLFYGGIRLEAASYFISRWWRNRYFQQRMKKRMYWRRWAYVVRTIQSTVYCCILAIHCILYCYCKEQLYVFVLSESSSPLISLSIVILFLHFAHSLLSSAHPPSLSSHLSPFLFSQPPSLGSYPISGKRLHRS